MSYSLEPMRNERKSASVPLLLVRQLSTRTNAIPRRTPLPPLPKLEEVTKDNIISIPILSDEDLDAWMFSRIHKQAKGSI